LPVSTTTALDLAKRPRGSSCTAFCGMVTITTSRARAASSTVDAIAPVSAASATSDSGPRELAIRTWCPRAARCRARMLPIRPEPMIPMSMNIPL
jgi:hypothetical protein